MEEAGARSVAKGSRRRDLRHLNLAAWERDEPAAPAGGLDTSLKRNTAFIKRLRTTAPSTDSATALIHEMAALRLDKYISELAPAAAEGAFRAKTAQEISAAVEIISALHQRFSPTFTVPFVASLYDTLAVAPPAPTTTTTTSSTEARERDEAARVAKQRSSLRLFGELEAIAVIKGKDGSGRAHGEELFDVLKRLITADKSNLSGQLPLVTAFGRHLGEIYLPAAPLGGSDSVDDSDDTIPQAQKDKFQALLLAFFNALSKRAVKDRLALLETDRRNHEAYIRSGEIFEDRAQAYEKAVKTWEKEWAGLQTLSEILGEAAAIPALPELPTRAIATTNVTLHSDSQQVPERWLDEEEQACYETLPDLRNHLPPDVTRDAAQIVETPAVAATENDPTPATAAEGPSETPQTEVGADEPPSTVDEALPAASAGLASLLDQLPALNSRDAADRLALEAAIHMRSKANRKRAVQALSSPPRNRSDLLVQYARVVAILTQVFADIVAGVLTELEGIFRWLQRKKAADIGDMRLRNAIYFSELTKFGIVPPHTIFHIYRVCLDDLSNANVDYLCTLLETCGRYLLRTPSTRETMLQNLDIAKRKQAALNLDQRQVSMLENAYLQCDPPDRVALPPKVRTPMVLFIRYLIYDLLSRSTVDKVLKLLRKLHWDDEETRRKLFNAFSKVWKIRSSHVQLLALLLYDLKAHPDFQVAVIDTVLERIRVGLETNKYKANQRRVADIKYLGEFLNFRLVPARVITDTLWLLLTFGHPDSRPRPDVASALDAPDDFFRCRLFCVLLETCHLSLDKGPEKKRIDHLLTFFELYLCCKQRQPMDVEYMVQDLFDAIRPKLKRVTSHAEAEAAVDDMLSSLMREEASAVEEDIVDDADSVEEAVRPDDFNEDATNSTEPSTDDDELDEEAGDDETEEVDTRRSAMSNEDREDFERDLAALMIASSTDRNRPVGKAARLDVGIPIGRRDGQARPPDDDDHTVFTLLTRRGAKQQTHNMHVPSGAAIALNSRSRQLESRAEQEQMKRLVLDYTTQQV